MIIGVYLSFIFSFLCFFLLSFLFFASFFYLFFASFFSFFFASFFSFFFASFFSFFFLRGKRKKEGRCRTIEKVDHHNFNLNVNSLPINLLF